MEFKDLSTNEQNLFLKIIEGKESEIFMENGEDFYPLISAGLITEMPTANGAAGIFLTHAGKKLRDQIIQANAKKEE